MTSATGNESAGRKSPVPFAEPCAQCATCVGYSPHEVLDVRVLVLRRRPSAGKVKTRLCPPYTPAQAATLAAAALRDTLRAVARRRPASGRWCSTGGQRWSRQLASTLSRKVRVGSMSESLPRSVPAQRRNCCRSSLDGHTTTHRRKVRRGDRSLFLDDSVDAVIGPAEDGGYWAVGLRHANADAFLGVPMSRPWTYERSTCTLRSSRLAGRDIAQVARRRRRF